MYTPTNETHLNEIALKVQSTKGVSESVEVLMDELANFIELNISNPALLTEMVAELRSQKTALGKTVTKTAATPAHVLTAAEKKAAAEKKVADDKKAADDRRNNPNPTPYAGYTDPNKPK